MSEEGPTRVTVNLIPRSVAALECLVASKGVTKTDAINHALQVHWHLQRLEEDGGRVYTREKGSDELERLKFL